MIQISKPIIDEETINAVSEVLRSGIIAEGAVVKEFEEKFAVFCGTKFAVAVNSGTAALHVLLLSYGIGPQDEVLVPPLTFIATANACLYTGAKPVFCDINPDTLNIDPSDIRKKITKNTKAIIPVHLYGLPADMDEITQVAKEYKLIVIEDACQAHAAVYKKKLAGNLADAAAFSFYATKNITTAEGGMITTNDEAIVRLARSIRNHGQSDKYFHEILGYNYRLTNIAAAIGIRQLSKLDEFTSQRQKNAQYLSNGLGKIKGISVPPILKDRIHVFHQFCIKVGSDFSLSRDALIKRLEEKGVGARPAYPMPVYEQPLYKKLGIKGDCPNAQKVIKSLVQLPVRPGLTKEELDIIIGAFQEIVKG